MNHAKLVGGLILVGGCALGTMESVRAPGSVTLKPGGSATIEGTNWTLRFDSVISDSRCPIGVLCIQAGEALLALKLTNPLVDPAPGDGPEFTLGALPRTKYGFRITATEVTPLRRINQQIEPKDYRATLQIESTTQ
jgi:hypothetical protein